MRGAIEGIEELFHRLGVIKVSLCRIHLLMLVRLIGTNINYVLENMQHECTRDCRALEASSQKRQKKVHQSSCNLTSKASKYLKKEVRMFISIE